MNEKKIISDCSDDVIDCQLSSETQLAMKRLVESLPTDVVSLAWRSELNSKLALAEATRTRKRRLFLILSPSLGLAAAACLAIMFVVRPPSSGTGTSHHSVSAQSATLEDSLLRAHMDGTVVEDISGTALNVRDATPADNLDDSIGDPTATS